LSSNLEKSEGGWDLFSKVPIRYGDLDVDPTGESGFYYDRELHLAKARYRLQEEVRGWGRALEILGLYRY
jgi:hypothetical protein